MRTVAICSKGGIGKSTKTQNMVAALAEIKRVTVIDWNAECPQADEYRTLAKSIDGNDMFVIPKHLEITKQESLQLDHGLVAA